MLENTVRHLVTFPEPWTRRFEVETSLERASGSAVELVLPVWTPGSYLVREYARHIEGLAASDEHGRRLEVERTRKNRWRIHGGAGTRVRVRYRLHADELSVRTNFVDSERAFLVGAATFLFPAGETERPHELRIVPAEGWGQVVTPLEPVVGAQGFVFRAENYDRLVDAPILAGNPQVHETAVQGRALRLVQCGDLEHWDGAAALADVARIVELQARFWGALPYPAYTVFNLVLEAGGGLEHADSTVLLAGRWTQRVRADYRRWLSTVSHEHFHVWNVKRLRPRELGPFDYENEVYTRGLWVAEGVTSYFDELLLHRSGLSTRAEYLQDLGDSLVRLLATPGRASQTLADASLEAWIKLYRPDADSRNTRISYYEKGAIVAFLLDAELRRRSSDRVDLRDWIQLAYQRFAGERGFADGEMEALASELLGADLGPFFERALHSTDELDLDAALATFGLRWAREPESARPWLGLAARQRDGRLVVEEVRRGSPAWTAGIAPQDELIGLAGLRVDAESFPRLLERLAIGARVELLLGRRGRLLSLPVEIAVAPPIPHGIEIDPQAGPSELRRRNRWLAGEEV